MYNFFHTFQLKSRCKYCLSEPSVFSISYDKEKPKNISLWIKNSIGFMDDELIFRGYSLKESFSLTCLKTSYKSIDVSYYKNHSVLYGFAIKEYLYCKCRKTIWVHADIENLFRKHIMQRKCKYGISG